MHLFISCKQLLLYPEFFNIPPLNFTSALGIQLTWRQDIPDHHPTKRHCKRARGVSGAGIFYTVDLNMKLTKISEPVPDSAQIYLSSDQQLYILGKSINTIHNLNESQAAIWYDYELLETE